MFLDDLLKLADAQESTVSVASTSYIDTLAAGDSYEGAWMYVRVDTAFTAGAGEPHGKWSIETSETTDFAGTTVLASSDTYLAAELTAGKEIKIRIPAGARQYLRGYFTARAGLYGETAIADVDKFGSGKWDIFIVKDVDLGSQQLA